MFANDKKSKMMNILFSTDNNYVMPTGVLMTSIGINNPSLVHYFVIVDEDFLEENKQRLVQAATRYKAKIDFCTIGTDFVNKIPFANSELPSGLTIATFYRLFLTELLPQNVHKVIYLDVDMIVRKSLSTLWEIDMSGYAIAGVPDMDEYEHIASRRLPYPMETGYLNAGMLIVNIDFWREHNMFSKFMAFISEHKKILLANDQDILNSLFYDKKKVLPVNYNFQNGFLYRNKKYIGNLKADIERFMKDPVIVHYTGKKPWDIDCNNPMRTAWHYYKKHSLWKYFSVDQPKNMKMRLWYWLFRNNYWIRNVSKIPFNKHKMLFINN